MTGADFFFAASLANAASCAAIASASCAFAILTEFSAAAAAVGVPPGFGGDIDPCNPSGIPGDSDASDAKGLLILTPEFSSDVSNSESDDDDDAPDLWSEPLSGFPLDVFSFALADGLFLGVDMIGSGC